MTFMKMLTNSLTMTPSSLLLTVISGWHDLGNENVSKALGINTSAHNCRVSGTPFAADTCTRDRNFVAHHETSSWTGFASTAVSVAVSPRSSDAVPRAMSASETRGITVWK